ncbi:MAG: RHS repeat-associated core domain-containing protein [Bacteroidota bacterium]
MSSQDPGEEVEVLTFTAYDAEGRLTETVDPAGLTTTYVYGDPDGGTPFIQDLESPYLTGIKQDAASIGNDLKQHFEYDDLGRIAAIVDANGHATTFVYDGFGRLTETWFDADNDDVDPIQLATYEYNVVGAALGAYDENDPNWTRVTIHVDPDDPNTPGDQFDPYNDQVATAYFDGLGREIQSAARRSYTNAKPPVLPGPIEEVTHTEYDLLGRPTRAWRPVQITTNGEFTPLGDFADEARDYYEGVEGNGTGTSASTNRPYVTTTYLEDPLARVDQVLDPGEITKGATVRYGIDRPDVMADNQANPGWTKRPEGTVTAMPYVETEDADGRVTRTYTDGLGRERFIRAGLDPSGVDTSEETLTEFLYDAAGQLVEVRHPTYFHSRTGDTSNRDKRATRYIYDTRGLLREVQTPDAEDVKMLYDDAGRLRYRENGEQRKAGEVHFVTYDALGRVVVEGIGYPGAGCEWNNLDPDTPCFSGGSSFEANSFNWIRRNLYDEADPAELALWPWDADPAFTYQNPKGRVYASSNKSGGQWQAVFFSYDERGRVEEQWTRTDGVTLEWDKVSFEYDRAGQMTGMRVEVGTEAFEQEYVYDRLGRMVRSKSESGSAASPINPKLDFAAYYRAGGALRRLDYKKLPVQSPARSVHRTYRIEGWLHELGDVTNNSTSRAAIGSPLAAGERPPFAQTLTYSPGGMIERLDVRSAYATRGTPYTSPEYADAMAWDWAYDLSYDRLGRLAEAVYTPGGTSTYGPYLVRVPEYDANGNILQLERWTPSGGYHNDDLPSNRIDVLTYAYTKGTNKLASVTDAASGASWAASIGWDAEPWAYKYDRNGAMMWQKETATNDRLEWETVDENSQPTWVTLPDGTDIYYRYGADNQRITEEVGTDPVRRFVRVGGEVVGVFSGTTLVHWNIGGAGGGSGRIDASGARRYYYTDHLGSIRAVIKENGDLVEAADYYAFGLQMPGRAYVQGSPTREDFTSHELDQATSLHYMLARYYMGALGRFTSTDPHAASYPAWSPYSYVYNNPLSFTDPTGMDPCKDDGMGDGAYCSDPVEVEGDDLSDEWQVESCGFMNRKCLWQLPMFYDRADNSQIVGPEFWSSSRDMHWEYWVPPPGANHGIMEMYRYRPRPTLMLVGPSPTGLRSASVGLRLLFSAGSVRGRSIVGIRSTLTSNGFVQVKAKGNGYLLRHPVTREEVRMMSRNGGWDIRVRNRYGNYLDEAGNVAGPASTHRINIINQ